MQTRLEINNKVIKSVEDSTPKTKDRRRRRGGDLEYRIRIITNKETMVRTQVTGSKPYHHSSIL